VSGVLTSVLLVSGISNSNLIGRSVDWNWRRKKGNKLWHSSLTVWLQKGKTVLRIATVSLVMSARPSVRTGQFGFHLTDFHEIW